ncbi:RND superfamily permease [Natronomonas moolapensis 8.8.11]|uniref:RND superfamily permease n=1 Tax=Natronomonas moolapensis (strain DSM 18674 / CECT 7526 / JCM 14361 / 8.8.11) TaxID=268739 RepID=M1XQJ3_NATM8|nr:MMPL family transporter [Natronomonas moolapensis]CCQ36439.1 RND superfamily permease [Natronomonas moolapensis 8.8.11]
MDFGQSFEAAVEQVNEIILDRPIAVIGVFVLVTALLAGGMPLITTDSEATDAFTEGLPEQEALDAVNDEFGDRFEEDQATTQLIHAGDNVLAKTELRRSLTALDRTDRRAELRYEGAAGPAVIVARALDPTATTPEAQLRVVERASEREIRETIRELADESRFRALLSDDFNAASASASASLTVVTHDVPSSSGGGPDQGGGQIEEIQTSMQPVVEGTEGDIRVFGSGIISAENANVIGDSLTIVMPLVLLLILAFLIVAYRDPIDLVLGLIALVVTLVWTFGTVGYAGIPFDQNMIAVPVLLLAVGIDFGIHIINRYREERVNGVAPRAAMKTANRQLIVAFFIVTVTTVFGFGANVISDLGPISNFGLVAAIGISYTFFIFGIFLPALKIAADRMRDRLSLPEFGSGPISSEDSEFGQLLAIGATVSRVAPAAFVVLTLVIGGGAAAYGQDVDRSFDTDDFLPPEEIPVYIDVLPEPLAPSEYTATKNLNLIEDRFEASQEDTATIYLVGPFEDNGALESIHRTNRDPPESFIEEDRRAESTSIITVIQDRAARDPEFAALVERNDRNDNGVPDRNLDRIYDELETGDGRANEFLTSDHRAAKIEYDIEADAGQADVSADARAFAEEFRYTATATGGVVVFNAVSDLIFSSAIQSLVTAVILTSVFLVIVYGALERRPLLGLVNLFPILVTIALLLATMRAIGLPLNALTATLLSITVGVGVAYTVHITHRFVDEYNESGETYGSLVTTLSGTGGALTGSMLTTSIGTGALALAITPILGNFGLLMAVSVFFSYVSSILVLPPTLLLWGRHAPDLSE